MLSTSKVQRLFYTLYAYFAIFIGVTSYRYDFKRRLYLNSKWTKLITSLFNFCVIIFVSWDLYYVWAAAYGYDMVTELTVRLDTSVNDILCLLRVIQGHARERDTHNIMQDLRRLHRIYRYRNVGYEQKQLQGIYMWKKCILWVLLFFLMGFMMVTFDEFDIPINSHFLKRLLMVFYVLALDGLDMTMHIHFLITWRMCRLYSCLNRRLTQLIDKNDAVATLELHHLRWQHWQLAKLWQRLNITYNFILIASRFALLVTAAALGYYISIFDADDISIYFQCFGFGLYAVIAVNCYILDLNYDVITRSHREASLLIQLNNRSFDQDVQFSRGCELFVLQIANFPLQIKPYGLFVSGKAKWLSNIGCILGWIVVLLQYRIVSENMANKNLK